MTLVDDVTAEVFLKIHAALQGHAEIAGFVVGRKKLFGRINLINALPAAAIVRLQKRRKADILEDGLPVERVFEVAHGAAGGSLGMLIVRQQDGGWHGHAELRGQRIVEEFVVSAPPEWVIDD